MAPARYQGQVVFCHDVERTARLFVEVLGFQRAADDGSGDISLRAQVADSPSATVEIYLHPSPGPAAHHLGTFQVDDVDAVTYTLASRSCTIIGAPANRPWGVREATIKDPDDHELTLTSPTS